MSQPKIRIAIVDDHKLFREGIASLLGDFDELSVNLIASNGIELFNELIKRKRCVDVLLLDLEMPEMDGLEVLKKLKYAYPEIRTLILTMHNEDELIYELIELGAKGFLQKSADIEELVDAIYSLHSDEIYFNEDISKRVIRKLVKKNHLKKITSNVILSEREKEIVRLICDECTNKEIAEKLSLSERTIESHKKNLFEKTNSKNSAGIVLFAVRSGIVE